MTGTISPEAAGSRAIDVRRFMARMREYGVNLHSVIMQRGNDIFFEKYFAPFTANDIHRMYSVTKSFISASVGCLVTDGKLDINDPILKYFPEKLSDDTHDFLKKQTVRDMLMMNTCFASGTWFKPEYKNRVDFYFGNKPVRPSGTIFDYDSTGSYIMGVMVERIAGMPLLEYMKRRFLNEIGGFESAQILKTMDGTPWGDSAMLCTPRALLNFANLMMHGGNWHGRQLIDADYVRAATSRQTDNNIDDRAAYNRCGYGYQFWMTPRGSFSCLGMGGQLAVCVPDKDFIFVCTGDTQLGDDAGMAAIYGALFDCVVDRLDGSDPDGALPELDEELKLPVVAGEAASELAGAVSGRWFRLEPNDMGITRLRVCLNDGSGVLEYENAQGEKALPFGIGRNEFGKFPELGYSDEYGNIHNNTGFMYKCAASGAWVDKNKLRIRVQIIDRYLGGLVITLGWRDKDSIGVRMFKVAEDFLQTYNGWAGGTSEG